MLSGILHTFYIKRLFLYFSHDVNRLCFTKRRDAIGLLGNGTDWVLCTLFHYFSPPLAGVYCASQIEKLCWLLNFFCLCNRCLKGGRRLWPSKMSKVRFWIEIERNKRLEKERPSQLSPFAAAHNENVRRHIYGFHRNTISFRNLRLDIIYTLAQDFHRCVPPYYWKSYLNVSWCFKCQLCVT